jgi:hypothetical protein
VTKILTANSPEVKEFLTAMGIDQVGLKEVHMDIVIGQAVTIRARYELEIWVSNLKKTQEVFKKYELRELPP